MNACVRTGEARAPRKHKHFRTSRRDNFLCFSIDSGAPQKITSYIEDKMGGRRHGEELPPKITDCIEDEMGGRRGGKWGEGDGYYRHSNGAVIHDRRGGR